MAKSTKPASAEPSARDLVEKLKAAGEAAAAKAGVLQVLVTKDGFRLVWAVKGDNPNLRMAQDIPFADLAEDPEALLKACDRDQPTVTKTETKPPAQPAEPVAPPPAPVAVAAAEPSPPPAGPRGEAEREIGLAKACYAKAAEAPDGPTREQALSDARDHQARAAAAFGEALRTERAA